MHLIESLRKNSFLLTILALCFLCALLTGQARADGKGIPYNDQFVSASFPYARTVSGCTDWRRPAGMNGAVFLLLVLAFNTTDATIQLIPRGVSAIRSSRTTFVPLVTGT
jgi:hypothetical protein